MSDIVKRLEALGLKRASEISTPPQKKKSLFKVLEESFPSGFIGENDYGMFFINRLRTPLSQPHGCVDMTREMISTPLFDSIMGLPEIKKEETLAMDTETSGLSNGTGAFVFMIGMGYFSGDEYIVDQLILPDLCDEPAFIRQIELTFADYRTLLTYNGKGFDVPMIRSRSNFHLFPDFCSKIDHVDLLAISRAYWKRRLGSVRLANIENYVLKLERGELEIPSALAPELYREYLRKEDASVLAGTAYHNHIDVLSLSAYLLYLNDLCARSGEDLSLWEQEGACVQDLIRHNPDVLSLDLLADQKTLSLKDKKELVRLYIRQKNFEKAAALCLELGDTDSLLKAYDLYEKKLKDPERAAAARTRAEARIESDETLGPWRREELRKKLGCI